MVRLFKELHQRRIRQVSLLAISLYCLFVTNYNPEDSNSNGRRMLSIDQNCTINPTKEIGPNDSPVFIASFPGSGSRLSWKIVEGLTGKVTGDEWNSNGLGKNVVALKTHWPHPTHGNKLEWVDDIERAFILIRNPMHVLPAFHNAIYSTINEDEEGLNMAPTESWLKWRDSNFNQQLFLWRVNIQYWLDKYHPKDRVVIPYERIVDDVDGPRFSQELNLFLGAPGNNPLDLEKVPCVWSKVMELEDSYVEESFPTPYTFTAQGRLLRRTKRFERSYTKEQYNSLIVIVRDLRKKYGEKEKRLDNTFEMYEASIRSARDNETYNDLYMVR